MEMHKGVFPEASGSRVLSEDLYSLSESALIRENTGSLQGSVILVTGGTGLVGSLLIRNLLYLNRVMELGIKILAPVRNPGKARDIYGDLAEREDFCVISAGITSADDMCGLGAKFPKIDYIFHAAAVTTSKTMVEQPVETIFTAIDGTRNLLELARNAGCRCFVYISSMEMYGNLAVYEDCASGAASCRADEDKAGYIDPLKIRSNYPESKRMCENLCIAYQSEYGVPVRIARLAQTFGAGILKGENRVFAQFARSAMTGTDIVLHTKGLSEGNYCYTADAMRGLLTILLKGNDGEAYNVSNPDTHTTIAGMAQMVADTIAEGKIQVVFDIPESNTFGYAADTRMLLPNDKLVGLGWKPEADLPEAYRRLIRFLKEQGEAYLRPVEDEDVKRLHEWRNEESVRLNSFNTEPIPYENHEKWFARVMGDDNEHIYILMAGEPVAPAGQIRITLVPSTVNVPGTVNKLLTGEISYSIDKGFRGLGLGTKIVALVEEEARSYVSVLTARVKASNKASIHVFESNGYTRISESEDEVEFRKDI